MGLESLWIAIPIFAVVYSGMGLFFETKRPKTARWEKSRPAEESSLLKLTHQLGALGFNKAILKNEKFRERLELLLVRAGHPFGWTAEDLLFYKEFGVLLAAFFLWYGQVTNWLIWPFMLYLGFWIPEGLVKSRAAERQADILRKLPGVIDLLTLTLEGGLDLLAAIEKIFSKMKPGALRDELQTLMQESRLGTPRKEALQHLAHRTNVQEVQSFTSMVIQSEELGTSLAVVLRTYAEDMRSRRILRAEEFAGKAPVKMLLPMMLFFFPIMIAVIIGPIILSFMKMHL